MGRLGNTDGTAQFAGAAAFKFCASELPNRDDLQYRDGGFPIKRGAEDFKSISSCQKKFSPNLASIAASSNSKNRQSKIEMKEMQRAAEAPALQFNRVEITDGGGYCPCEHQHKLNNK